MNLIERFRYQTLERHTQSNGIRHYVCPESCQLLPSVTTILAATGDKTKLIEWRQRIGERKAEQIKEEACALGSLMHTHLECYIRREKRPGVNNYIRLLAERMANQIIERGLVQIDAVYGIEVALYYPGLYAGTTDLVCSLNGQMAIVDHKSANKLKKSEQIEDYFLQLSAYILAHNHLHGTTMDSGAIFMVSRDYEFRQFNLEKSDFRKYGTQWLARLEQYHG